MEKRPIITIVADFFDPDNPCITDPEIDGRRRQAIVEVLELIPNNAYEKLRTERDQVKWFIPNSEQWGAVELMEKDFTKMIYLSPALERRSCDINVAVAAHEIAHIILGHRRTNKSKDCECKKQENEAFDLSCEWGFGKQAKKHRAICIQLAMKAKKSQEKALNEILKI